MNWFQAYFLSIPAAPGRGQSRARNGRWCALWLWLWLAGGPIPGAAQTLAAMAIQTLSQLNQLPDNPGGPGRPLRLTGVVLCCDPGWHQLYIFDGHETGYFNADEVQPPPIKGRQIELTGVARGSNLLAGLQLTITGSGPLPPARSLQISGLGQDHAQWVEITGRVMTAETSRGRLALLLHNQGLNALIYVLGSPPPNEFKKYLGCQVRVRGINASTTTLDGALDAPMLFVPGLD